MINHLLRFRSVVSASSSRPWLRVIFCMVLCIVTIYSCYWLYLTLASLRSPDSSDSYPFAQIGKEVVARDLVNQGRIKIVPYVIDGPDNCSFWKFETILKQCRSVGVVVLGFDKSQQAQVIRLTERLAEALARPCKNLGLLEASKQADVGRRLGCGGESVHYVLRVQAFSSEALPSPSGGGVYRNEHIYTSRKQGVI